MLLTGYTVNEKYKKEVSKNDFQETREGNHRTCFYKTESCVCHEKTGGREPSCSTTHDHGWAIGSHENIYCLKGRAWLKPFRSTLKILTRPILTSPLEVLPACNEMNFTYLAYRLNQFPSIYSTVALSTSFSPWPIFFLSICCSWVNSLAVGLIPVTYCNFSEK